MDATDKSCVTCADWPGCERQKLCRVWGGEWDDMRVVELRFWKVRSS